MKIKTYLVDAFTDQPFKGNPAGVCIIENDIDDFMMLSIAKELVLSETAFVKKNIKEEFETKAQNRAQTISDIYSSIDINFDID
jgi:PhzF family phenazine biosynthesis protein